MIWWYIFLNTHQKDISNLTSQNTFGTMIVLTILAQLVVKDLRLQFTQNMLLSVNQHTN